MKSAPFVEKEMPLMCRHHYHPVTLICATVCLPPNNISYECCDNTRRSFKNKLYRYNKTDVERRQTLGPLRSINPDMINHLNKQSPLLLSKSYMLSVHEAIKISYSYHLWCQRWRNCQKMSVTCWMVVDIHGSVAFSKLPIYMENLSRLSKHTLSIISIS